MYVYNVTLRYKGDTYDHIYVKVCKVFTRTKMFRQLRDMFEKDIIESFSFGIGSEPKTRFTIIGGR